MPKSVEVGCRAERHHRALVRCLRVDRDRRVPEHAQHRHALAVVPRAGSNRPAWPRDPPHLGDTRLGVAHEVDDELAEGGVERAVRERNHPAAADTDVGSRQRRPRTPWTNGSEGSTAATALGPAGRQLCRQRAGAAADVDRTVTLGDTDRSREDGGQGAGPDPCTARRRQVVRGRSSASVGHRVQARRRRRPVKTLSRLVGEGAPRRVGRARARARVEARRVAVADRAARRTRESGHRRPRRLPSGSRRGRRGPARVAGSLGDRPRRGRPGGAARRGRRRRLRHAGSPFRPGAGAAPDRGIKAFAKDVMRAAGVPTAADVDDSAPMRPDRSAAACVSRPTGWPRARASSSAARRRSSTPRSPSAARGSPARS